MESSLDKFTQDLQKQIMEEVRRDYSKTVIDHWMNPRNFGKLDNPDGYGRITGPCGDTMEIFLKIKDEKIEDAHFLTDGCGTTIACGSVITELIKGKTIEQVKQITSDNLLKKIGGLPPLDEHCVVLATNTLQSAINNL